MDRKTLFRQARERLAMTQEHLAAAAGLSARTVIRAEQGRVISAEAVRALCAVLELDVRALPEASEGAAEGAGGAGEEGNDEVARGEAAEPMEDAVVAGTAAPVPAVADGGRTASATGRALWVRLLERVGHSDGGPEAGAGLLGAALAAWSGSALWHGTGGTGDALACAVGAALLLTLGLDRLWRWAGLYGADVAERPALAFRATTYAVAAAPMVMLGGGLIGLA